MGMCKPSGGISKQIGRIGDLKPTGNPNTRKDLYNEDGKLIQQRWYGPDGNAIWDRDWAHGGGEHEWPHDHSCDWNNPQHPDRPAYEDEFGNKTNSSYC